MARRTPISRSRSITSALSEKSTPATATMMAIARSIEVTAKVSSKMSNTRRRSAACRKRRIDLPAKSLAKCLDNGVCSSGVPQLQREGMHLLFLPIAFKKSSGHQDCPSIAREIPVDSANGEFFDTRWRWQR